MKGETVTVKTFSGSGEKDPFGADVSTPSTQVVDNVLVAVGARADLQGSNRPNADTIRYTLHFPKTFSGKDADGNSILEDAEVEVRGKWYKVVGVPDHYTLENTPTQWWLPVEVQATNG